MIVYKGLNKLYIHEDVEKLRHLIVNDYDETTAASSITNFSYRLEKYLIQSGLADLLDILNCGITFVLIIFYITSTYTYPSDENDTYITMNSMIDTIEIFLCVFLISHIGLRLYTSQNRLIFLFTLENLVDIGTIAPILLAKQSFIREEIKYYMRFFRMVRIIYFFKVENILQRRTNENVRYTYKLIIYIVAIIFLSTSLILELENQYTRQETSPDLYNSKSKGLKGSGLDIKQFHDMLYYMLVTLGTIGFGDVTPKTTMARFTIIITLLIMVAVIPTLFQKLSTINALTSKYSRMSYKKYSKETKHLILLGSCGVEGFEAFLQELYHEDHGQVEYQTVIMQSFPDEEIMNLIKDYNLSNKIFYLVGNSLVHKDLERCKADTAECVVLLANKLAKNPRYEDFSNILQAFSVKKFAKIFSGRDVRICIQLLRPETKEIYFSSLINRDDMNLKDQVICVEEIKLQLIGKSCLCPGINTIVSSLITSKKPHIDDPDLLPPEMQWLKEYLDGMQNEIYRIKMNKDVIQGLRFIDLVKIIYEISSLIVVGVDVIFDRSDPLLCLNPYGYVFSPQDHYVYVLADKLPNSQLINSLAMDYMNKLRQGDREEIIKYLRIRNPSWENRKDTEKEESNENSQKRGIKFKNVSTLKKKESSGPSKKNFIQTTFPRTGYEAENFSTEILNNHIVVCGLIQNMKNLIYPLRATSMKNEQYPILIVDKEDHIPSEIWKEIQYFPDIYFMQGNPIKSKDLHRACIKKAKAVIILTKNNFDEDSHEMIDADTIFIYKAIRNENKNILIIADLASLSTIGFISTTDEKNYQKQGYRLSEQFAVGEIYTGSMLDTLMCQSFYNEYITDILQQLILGSASFSYSPALIKKLQDRKINQSTLYLLNIHEELEKMEIKNTSKKMNFSVIFNYFVEKNMVPIGIYRNSKSSSGSRSMKNDKYVYLCPLKDDEIFIEHDKIYVLISEDENQNNHNTIKQKAVALNNKNLKLIEKSNDLAGKIVDNLKELLTFNYEALQTSFSVKKIVDLTRTSLRKEFVGIHETAKHVDKDKLDISN